MGNGCGASKEGHISQNFGQNEIPLPWRSIPGQQYPLMAVTEQFWRCCVYKGYPGRVCGRLNWFLPSLPFFHCFPNADSETWLKNLISWWQCKWSRTNIWILCQHDHGEEGYVTATEWTSDFHMPSFYLSPTHKKHRWQGRERQMCKI